MSKDYPFPTLAGNTGSEQFREQFGEAAYERWANSRGTPLGARPGDADGGVATEEHNQKLRNEWNHRQAAAAATGSWLGGGTPNSGKDHPDWGDGDRSDLYTAQLRKEYGMDYGDIMKYGKMAGIANINNESDYDKIAETYENAHTSKDELDAAMEDLRSTEEDKNKPKEYSEEYSARVTNAMERVKQHKEKTSQMASDIYNTPPSNNLERASDRLNSPTLSTADDDVGSTFEANADDALVSEPEEKAEQLKNKYVLDLKNEKTTENHKTTLNHTTSWNCL